MTEPGGRSGVGLTPKQMVSFALIFFGIGALFLLAWQVRHVLLLLFGAIVIAVVLRSIASPFRDRLRFPDWAALIASVLTVAGVLGIAGWLVGSEVSAQVAVLADQLPAAWEDLQRRFSGTLVGDMMEALRAQADGAGIVSSLGRMGWSLGTAVIDIVIVIVAGIFLAASPQSYRTGLLKMVPRERREMAADTIEASGRALGLWLRGQLIQMVLIGTLTGIGLAIIGVPSALTLGIFAGLLEFVPFIGPIVASIPALLLAATQGMDTFLWTLGLYLVIQQIEGNLIQPLVQRHAVKIPPVILLFAILLAAPLFGLPGVLLAAPLAVFVFVLVKRLYVREALDTPTSLPGEK
ncbi:MAG: AI-2E family transporter [Thermaurantiacus sp.]